MSLEAEGIKSFSFQGCKIAFRKGFKGNGPNFEREGEGGWIPRKEGTISIFFLDKLRLVAGTRTMKNGQNPLLESLMSRYLFYGAASET